MSSFAAIAPLSRGVELRELPERFEAVASLGGGSSANGARAAAAARELLASLRADGLHPVPAPPGAGGVRTAQLDPMLRAQLTVRRYAVAQLVTAHVAARQLQHAAGAPAATAAALPSSLSRWS